VARLSLNPLRPVRFFYLALSYPIQFKAGIINGGFGIEERALKYKRLWRVHLERTKREILEQLTGEGESLTVLGAGRLLDLPLAELAKRYREIRLIDFDPGALPILKTAARKIGPGRITVQLSDITNSIASFSKGLDSSTEAIKFAADFVPTSPPAIKGDVLSLNLLSQLSHSFLSLLKRKLIQSGDGLSEEDLIEVLTPLAHRIINQHLKLLQGPEVRSSLLITDILQNDASTLFGYELDGFENSWEWQITPTETFKVVSRVK